MQRPQQAGTIDRYFNSTIGLPQQLLWRIIRAAKSDDFISNLFSEKGLLDFALVPGLGIMDTHKHDVMPDYMAKSMGFSNDLKGQLSAAILTDPLTYLTGGLSASAKSARAGVQLGRSKAVREAIDVAAKQAGKSSKDFFNDLTVQGFNDIVAPLTGKGALREESKGLIKRLNQLNAPEAGFKPDDLLSDIFAKTADRKLALGLPGLARLGVKIDMPTSHQSWWSAFTSASKKTSDSLGVSFVTRGIVSTPFVRPIAEIPRQFKGGWSVGKEARTAIRDAEKAFGSEDYKAIVPWLDSRGGGDIIPALAKADIEKVQQHYDDLILRDETTATAVESVLRKFGGKTAKEQNLDTLWARLSGRGLDDGPFKFSIPKDPGKARKVLLERIERSVNKYGHASQRLAPGELSDFLVRSKAGEMSEALRSSRAALRYGDGLAEMAFNLGTSAKAAMNRLFITGTDTRLGKDAYEKFLGKTAAAQDQAAQMGKLVFAKMKEALKDMPGATESDVNKLFMHLMEATPLEAELAAAAQLAKINPSNAKKVLQGLDRFVQRHHSSMRAIEEVLKSSSIPKNVRDTIGATLSSEVYSFIPTLSDSVMRARFDRMLELRRAAPTVEFGPRAARRMRRAHNNHALGGTKYGGRLVGTMTDDEITDALGQIEKQSQRAMNNKEVREYIEQDPILSGFAKRYDITPDELLAVMKRRGRGKTRKVKHEFEGTPDLWDETRTRWTGAQANAALEDYKLKAVRTDGGWILDHFSGLRPKSLRGKGFKIAKLTGQGKWSHEYPTIGHLMDDAFVALASNPGYRNKYGPGIIQMTRDVRIPSAELDLLRKAIGKETDQLLRGKTTIFDERMLPGYGTKITETSADALDYRRLQTALERRQYSRANKLKETDELYDGISIGKPIEGSVSLDGPRRVSEDALFFDELGEGGVRGVDDLSTWARAYGRARMTLHELQHYIRKSAQAGITPEIPPEMVDDIAASMSEMSTLVNDTVLEALPKSARQVMQSLRTMQSSIFNASRASGVFMPGSPVAYIGRYFNKNGRERIKRVMGEIEGADLEALNRLGMKAPSRFGRTTDHMTIDDLNELHTWLRESAAKGDAKAKTWFDEVESVMQQEGVKYRGYKGKLPWSDERINGDPALALLMRLNHANQDVNIEEYFSRFLAGAEDAPGQSLATGGRVLAVVDDGGRTVRRPYLRNKVKEAPDLGPDGKRTGTSTKTIAETEEQLEHVPRYLLIETDAGKQHLMPLAYQEDGFGVLQLGDAHSLDSGFQSTTAKAFVHASMRSDLEKSFARGATIAEKAHEMIGKHVVFGSEHSILGAVKTAAKTMEVAPSAWRTFDSINYMIKSFQTVFRVPFQAYNLASGVFQARMAGVSPKNLTASYIDTFKLLHGDTEFLKKTDMLSDLLDVKGATHDPSLFTVLPHNDVVDAIRRMGGTVGKDFDTRVLSAAGLDKMPNALLRFGKDEVVTMTEFMEAAADHHLFGTFASSLSRGSRTVSDSLVALKMSTLNPDMFDGTVKKGVNSLIESLGGTAGELREAGEVINRMSTAIGLLREGHPLDRAMQIAKNAHVPYERLTPFERNFAKRAITYYSFPRHYMPWAWSKFMGNPTKLSQLANTIKNQKLVTTDEGEASLKLGDYRMNLGRINANAEAAMMLGAFADRFAVPVLRSVPGVMGMGAGDGESLTPYDPNILSKSLNFGGLMSVGGVAGLLTGGGSLLPQGRRERFAESDTFREARTMIWPMKAFFAGMRATGLDTDYTTKEEQTPYVDYTDMERFIADNDFGLGVRKVRPKAEIRRAYYEFQELYRGMKLKIAATDDERQRERYIGNIRVLAHTLKGMASASMQ